MGLAIVAAILAIAALAIVVVVVFVAYNRFHKDDVPTAGRKVTSITADAVAGTGGARHAASHTTLQTDHSPSGNPSGDLKGRFAFLGGFAAFVFGLLAVKIFSMQVIHKKKYSRQAEENRHSTVSTPAPRGYICDASGLPLVKNRTSLTVLAEADVADNRTVVTLLSVALGIPQNVVRARIMDSSAGAQSQRVVASDVELRSIAFIREHSDAFPGVTVETRTVREYPYGALCAHVLGYTGTVSEDDLEVIPEGRDIQMGDEVGKSGVEASYDAILSGDHGQRVVVADADGNVKEVTSETKPKKGSDIHLTIDAKVQHVADLALAELIAPINGTIGTGKGVAGSVIVMDVEDGSIIAMSNYPTFEPEEFIGGISQESWELYTKENSQNPLMNRALAGAYPAASTFKAFTSIAGLEYGFADYKKKWNCKGSWDGWKTGAPQMCWKHSGHGKLTLRGGIVNSCDVVFYEIAKKFFDKRGSIGNEAMQDVIKKFNFGVETGIDLGGEIVGRVPTPDWKLEQFKDTPEEADWRGGDLTNMVIGQGYVLITPIQLAVAYAAIATGKMVKPHVLKEVRNVEGDAVVKHETEFIGDLDVKQEHLEFVREALHGVATENDDIKKMFKQNGVDAAAKTGTAEVAGKDDFAWFACYAPYKKPKYVCIVLVEEGGGGSATAAPVGAQVMGAALKARKGKLDEDLTKVPGSTGKFKKRKHSDTGRTD